MVFHISVPLRVVLLRIWPVLFIHLDACNGNSYNTVLRYRYTSNLCISASNSLKSIIKFNDLLNILSNERRRIALYIFMLCELYINVMFKYFVMNSVFEIFLKQEIMIIWFMNFYKTTLKTNILIERERERKGLYVQSTQIGYIRTSKAWKKKKY